IIKRFNFSARNLDRFFLNELTEVVWRKEVYEFLLAMSGVVIDSAMMHRPAEIREIFGPRIAPSLKKRIQYLAQAEMEYYRFISKKVNITASDASKLIDITRHDDGSALVNVFQLNEDEPLGDTIYPRHFDGKVTEEINIYGFGGNDKFVVKGSEDKIKIRLIGGEGNDSFINESNSGGGAIVYDSREEENEIIGRMKNKISADTSVNDYEFEHFKYNQ